MAKKKTNGLQIFRYIYVGIIMLCLLVGFVLIAEDVMYKSIFQFDIVMHDFVMDIRTGFLTVIFKIITNLANPLVMGIIGLLLFFYLKDNKHYCFALFLNMGITALLNLTLKAFFVRDRPDSAQSLITEYGFSFPSGHAMFAIAFYGFIMFLVWKSTLKKSARVGISVGIITLILLICFSRIYLGVHYASDVIGAIFITIDYMIIFLFIVNRSAKFITEERHDYKRHTFLYGFKFAFQGIISALREENNLLVQFSASMLVIVFGVFLRISMVEWAICIILCFLVVCFEMINTALENVCDTITLEKDARIKKIKDISAGAVLAMSICAVIVALIIFLPKIQLLFI